MKAYINSTIATELVKILNHKHKDTPINRWLHITPSDKSVIFHTFTGKENIRVRIKNPLNREDKPFAVELDEFITALKTADKHQLMMFEALTTVKSGKDGYTKHYTIASFFSGGFASAVELPGIPANDSRLDNIQSAFDSPQYETTDQFLVTDQTKDKFNMVSKFSSDDLLRPVLSSVHLHEGNMIATDGRRLMVAKTEFNQGLKCTIPTAILKMLASLPKQHDGIFNVLKPKDKKAHGQKFEFFSDNKNEIQVSINGDLLSGNYPNYKQVIPSSQSTTITFSDPKGLQKLLKTNNRKKLDLNSVKFTFSPENPSLCQVRVNKVTATTTVHIQGDIPKEELCFNPGFFSQKLEYGFCCFHLTDGMSPITFTNPQGDIGVLMPIRTPSSK